MLMLPQNAKRNKEDCKVLAERTAFVAAAIAEKLLRMPEAEISEHEIDIRMLQRRVYLRQEMHCLQPNIIGHSIARLCLRLN
jgi:hypothetical protein